MDTRQVAEELGVSRTAVNRLASRGTLAYLWKGGVRLYRKSVIDAYKRDEAAQARRRVPSSVRVGQGVLSLDQAVKDAKRASTRSAGDLS